MLHCVARLAVGVGDTWVWIRRSNMERRQARKIPNPNVYAGRGIIRPVVFQYAVYDDARKVVL